MDNEKHRWTLQDMEGALDWCKARNEQGIACIVDILGEDIKDEGAARRTLDSFNSLIDCIGGRKLDASVSVKLTALGVLFDPVSSTENLFSILRKAQSRNVCVELDMEGTPLVDLTLDAAIAGSGKGLPLTLALQAYLERTANDIERVLEHGIRVRLVKGAYRGDYGDFEDIQMQLMSLFSSLLGSKRRFVAGTHDPVLLEWMRGKAVSKKDVVGFAFLMGLSDETKVAMVNEGWSVSEYVPFGSEKAAYELRRRRYLSELGSIGRAPAP